MHGRKEWQAEGNIRRGQIGNRSWLEEETVAGKKTFKKKVFLGELSERERYI
jgi:hypothetical protein